MRDLLQNVAVDRMEKPAYSPDLSATKTLGMLFMLKWPAQPYWLT